MAPRMFATSCMAHAVIYAVLSSMPCEYGTGNTAQSSRPPSRDPGGPFGPGMTAADCGSAVTYAWERHLRGKRHVWQIPYRRRIAPQSEGPSLTQAPGALGNGPLTNFRLRHLSTQRHCIRAMPSSMESMTSMVAPSPMRTAPPMRGRGEIGTEQSFCKITTA